MIQSSKIILGLLVISITTTFVSVMIILLNFINIEGKITSAYLGGLFFMPMVLYFLSVLINITLIIYAVNLKKDKNFSIENFRYYVTTSTRILSYLNTLNAFPFGLIFAFYYNFILQYKGTYFSKVSPTKSNI
ncbi:MAG: hypothetical protein EAZ42_04130 [Verrucomicrobia bacterium]|nr:MAG: hypothetical protein EAZ42_04130 [Verrucomicrobiota bacterium]